MGRLLRFTLVGSLGFVADASLLVLFVRAFGFGPLPARILSFALAASLTFELNRRFTFKSKRGPSRLPLYVLLTGVGALMSFGVFVAWIRLFGDSNLHLVLGTGAGSITALTFNFLASGRVIFAAAGPPSPRR